MKKLVLFLLAILCIKSGSAQFNVLASTSTSFENNTSAIHIAATTGNIWQIGTPQKAFFGTSHSASYSIMTDSSNSYSINNFSTFTFEYSDTNNWYFIPDAEIGFWHKYEMDSLKDGGFVEISLDSGATWTNVARAWSAGIQSMGEANFYNSYNDTIQGNIPAFTGTHANWEYSTIKLQWLFPVKQTSMATLNWELTYKVMFRFVFKSDNIQTNKAGWIIDDLTIKIYDVGGSVHENGFANFDVQVYPNPIKEKGIIQVVPKNKEHDFTICIYNAVGQLITTSKMDKNNQYIINTNDLNSGIYFYFVKSDDGTSKSDKLLIK